MLKRIGNFFFKPFRLYIFKIQWKLANKHNTTTVCKEFPRGTVKVGKQTYGILDVHTYGSSSESLVIGSYVSIASGVKFLLGGDHRTDTISTYPFKVKLGGYASEASTKGPILIEDDVWIGTDAKIMSGVKVGQGAIIAAGTLVTKNVEPYTIVGGIPARLLKYRVPKELIPSLIQLDINDIESLFRKEPDSIYKKLNKEHLSYIQSKIERTDIK